MARVAKANDEDVSSTLAIAALMHTMNAILLSPAFQKTIRRRSDGDNVARMESMQQSRSVLREMSGQNI